MTQSNTDYFENEFVLTRYIKSFRKDYISPESCVLLLSNVNDNLDNLIIRLSLFNGLTPTEIQHFNSSWFDLTSKSIRIPDSQDCDCYECKKWRNSIWRPEDTAKKRILPISKNVINVLSKTRTFRKRSRQSLSIRLKNISVKSNVKVYPSSLRATFAINLLRSGMSVQSIAYLMGWKFNMPTNTKKIERKAISDFLETDNLCILY
jgi:integrase